MCYVWPTHWSCCQPFVTSHWRKPMSDPQILSKNNLQLLEEKKIHPPPLCFTVRKRAFTLTLAFYLQKLETWIRKKTNKKENRHSQKKKVERSVPAPLQDRSDADTCCNDSASRFEIPQCATTTRVPVSWQNLLTWPSFTHVVYLLDASPLPTTASYGT